MAKHDKIKTETIQGIIADYSRGKNLKTACEERGFDYPNICKRISADPELTQLHTQAREFYAHSRVCELDEVARTEVDVQRARLICDNIKWETARVLPKFYGDKVQTEIGNIDNRPFKTESKINPETMTDDELNSWLAARKKN